jgi:hypothetical protein
MTAQFKPTSYNSVSPYLIVNGARATIDFLKGVFGAVELRQYPDRSGRLMHAEVRIDDTVIMLADPSHQIGHLSQPTSTSMSVMSMKSIGRLWRQEPHRCRNRSKSRTRTSEEESRILEARLGGSPRRSSSVMSTLIGGALRPKECRGNGLPGHRSPPRQRLGVDVQSLNQRCSGWAG